MAPELAIIAFVAVVGVGYSLAVGRPLGRLLNPLRIAFALTALSLIDVGAAAFGIALPSHHFGSLHELKRVGHVIWPQVELGIVFALLAIPMWWVGLRQAQ